MKKLTDYISEETKKSSDLLDQKLQKSINESLLEESYKENFIKFVYENLRFQILKLKSKDVIINETELKIDEEPFLLKYEILLTINDNEAQYFLELSGNSWINEKVFALKIESSGLQKSLPEKEILFDDVIKLNFEDYLVNLLQEFD